jgi:serine/threonine protein kinase/formylglycine-generating enzyme required for sulfatase activity
MPYDYPIRFGKYFLTRRIAVGGMAEVFKAKMVGIKGFEKILALKKILPEFSEDEEFVQMFVDEARISSNLHHSNIVQVFDFGKVENSYYIAMEHVDGPNLKNLFQRTLKLKPIFPRNLAFYILMQIARALEYAHTVRVDGKEVLNLVHRDVSPQNVLISRSGDIKITDFGIAKATIKLSKTQPGKVQGKFSYMSPEQALGKPLDHRSDIFSLGIIAFEMLTGVKVYAAEDTHKRYKQVREALIPRLGTIAKDIPAEIESLVMSMVARDPKDRPQTCGEIASKISEYLSDVSTEQLTNELGMMVDEIFPVEQSDVRVNQKISAWVEGRIEPQVESQPLHEGFRIIRPSESKTDTEETTISNWGARLFQSRLVLITLISLVVAGIAVALYWARALNQKEKEAVETAHFAPPRSGPVDPDIRSEASQREEEAEERLRDLEKKLEEAEKRAETAQKQLKKAEEKLVKVESTDRARPAMALPQKPCPSDMVLLKAGAFYYGSSRDDPAWNEMVEPASRKTSLPKFCIDRYEFPNRPHVLPKVSVSWSDAQALCASQGKRLCTQEEWERGCKGLATSEVNRRYPYGQDWSREACNTEKKDGAGDLSESPLRPTGSFSACKSPDGIYDLSGNADEWTSSRGRFSGESRVTRGGSSKRPDWATRCSSVREVISASKEADIGFRCCKDSP